MSIRGQYHWIVQLQMVLYDTLLYDMVLRHICNHSLHLPSTKILVGHVYLWSLPIRLYSLWWRNVGVPYTIKPTESYHQRTHQRVTIQLFERRTWRIQKPILSGMAQQLYQSIPSITIGLYLVTTTNHSTATTTRSTVRTIVDAT